MKLILKIVFPIILGLFFYSCNEGLITVLDYSNTIEDRVDTIEVSYVMWACACPNWIETDFLAQNSYIPENELESKCFYIEANKETEKLPEKYHTNFLNGNRFKVKLIGNFYKDKGISRDYKKPTSEKPEYAKVFRYNEFEVLVGK